MLCICVVWILLSLANSNQSIKYVEQKDFPAYVAYNEGVAFQVSGDKVNAISKYLTAVSLKPDLTEAHVNLGVLYDDLNDFDRSKKHTKLAIEYAPTNESKATYMANLALAITRYGQNNYESIVEVMNLLRGALVYHPTSEPVLSALGQAYFESKLYDDALQTLTKLVTLHPRNAMGLMNIGNYYFRISNFKEAIYWIERSLSFFDERDASGRLMALNNLAQAYRECGNYNMSLRALDQSILLVNFSLDSLSSQPISSLGLWAVTNHFTVRGLSCLWKDLEFREEVILRSMRSAYLQQTGPLPSGDGGTRSRAAADDVSLGVASSPQLDPYSFLLLRYASLMDSRTVSELVCSQPPIPYTSLHTEEENYSPLLSKRPLNVGYISYDWRDHPMGRLTQRLVTHHNTSRITSLSISYGPNDGSDVRRFVQSASPRFLDIFAVSQDETAASVIAQQGLDILVDLTSHTYNGRIELVARKPSRLGLSYLGYPGTSGCTGVDYYVANARTVPPETTRWSFSERIIFLPHTYQANHMPAIIPLCFNRLECPRRLYPLTPLSSLDGSPPRNPADNDDSHSDGDPATRDPKNLTEYPNIERIFTGGHPIICSFNAMKKLEPIAFAVWTSILRRVPNAVFVILSADTFTLNNIRNEFLFAGIDQSRIFLVGSLPWRKHLHRVAGCSLVLDVFVYGAHTTAGDVLWQGVPIVALEGYGSNGMPSRIAASLVAHLFDPPHSTQDPTVASLDAALKLVTICSTIRCYEDTAVRLLRSEGALRELRSRIEKNLLLGDSFDSPYTQLGVESAMQLAWEIRSHQSQVLSSQHSAGDVITGSVDATPSTGSTGYHIVVGGRPRSVSSDININYSSRTGSALHSYLLTTVRSGIGSLVLNEFLDLSEGCVLNKTESCKSDSFALVSRLLASYPSLVGVPSFRNVLKELGFRVKDTNGKEGSGPTVENSPIRSHFKTEPVPSNSPSESDATRPQGYSTVTTVVEPMVLEEVKDHHPEAEFTSDRICVLFDQSSSWVECLQEKLQFESKSTLSLIINTQLTLEKQGRCQESAVLYDLVTSFVFPHFGRYDQKNNTVAEVLSIQGLLNSDVELVFQILPNSTIWHELKSRRFSPWLTEALQQTSSTSTAGNSTFHETDVVMLLNNYGACLIKLDRKLESVMMQLESWLINTTRFRQLLNTAVTVENPCLPHVHYLSQEAGDPDTSYRISLTAVSSMHDQQFHRLDTERNLTVPSMYRSRFPSTDHTHSESKAKKKSIRIGFYCDEYGNEWWPRWGPKSVSSGGLGGSEEAVVFLAYELAELGYLVEIYANPPDDDIGWRPIVTSTASPRSPGTAPGAAAEVLWLHHSTYNRSDPVDVFVAWRYPISLALAPAKVSANIIIDSSRVRVLWLHDMLSANTLPISMKEMVDVVFVPSSFHMQNLPSYLLNSNEPRTRVLPNGLNSEYYIDGNNDNNRFIFASSPDRGLLEVLRVWSFIRDAIMLVRHQSSPSLHVFYGIRPSVISSMETNIGVSRTKIWLDEVKELLRLPGVYYHGSVNHEELSKALASTGFLLYPTRYPETSCITVMRAMALGAIPITSAYIHSALFNLTKGFDMGPSEVLSDGSDLYYHEWVRYKWGPSVVAAAVSDTEILKRWREKMIQISRLRYSWKLSADIFVNIIGGA